MMPLDLSGQRFGALVAVSLGAKTRTGQNRWRCRCDCGGESLVVASMLKRGRTVRCRACGECVVATKNTTHGHSKGRRTSRTYQTWRAMLARCTNPNDPFYATYGGRGISVCERWQAFDNFLADMGERPVGMSIDRFPDVNGNYEPGNCRWATPKQQATNRRSRA